MIVVNGRDNITIDIDARQSGKTIRMLDDVSYWLQEAGRRAVIVSPNEASRRATERMLSDHLGYYQLPGVISITQRDIRHNIRSHNPATRMYFDEFFAMEGLEIRPNSYYCGTPDRYRIMRVMNDPEPLAFRATHAETNHFVTYREIDTYDFAERLLHFCGSDARIDENYWGDIRPYDNRYDSNRFIEQYQQEWHDPDRHLGPDRRQNLEEQRRIDYDHEPLLAPDWVVRDLNAEPEEPEMTEEEAYNFRCGM